MTETVRNILFVCTGNTCRSPMAQVIAQSLLVRPEAEVRSAGLAAWHGSPATPEAQIVMDRQGLDLSEHSSQPVTRELIDWADVIYTMTESHRQAVLDMKPDASAKVMPLDPDGSIPDPIGMPIEVYEQTARVLRDLITRRLKELEL